MNKERSGKGMSSKIDLGMALLDMERWHRFSLRRDFTIFTGREALQHSLRVTLPDNFLDLLDPGGRQQFVASMEKREGASVDSNLFFTCDGTPLEILLIHKGESYELLYRNIENRLRSMDRLAIFFRHFLTSPNAICFTDPDAKIIDANRSFLDLYGYRLDEIVGNNPNILKSGRQSPAAYQDMWQKITDRSVGSWSGELINRKKDGEEIMVRVTVTAVRQSSGALIGFVASTRDITREKLLEQELHAQNEALAELSNLKSDLMAITSHDLKAPLNSIISRARLLRETSAEATPEKIQEQLDRIIAAGSRMTEFINDILDLEKIESGGFKLVTGRVHLDSLLRACVDTNLGQAEEKKLELVLDVSATAEPMQADILKLEQVFNNLLSNAIKFSPVGGSIRIACRDSADGKDVEIMDQGPGVPEEDRETIFDRYFQVKKKGLVPKRGFGVGLGLNIVKNIVEMHGGTIRVENIPEGGCAFIVHLPLRKTGSSTRNVAALLHDSDNTLFRYLQGPLQMKEVVCYMTKSEAELRRIFDYEKPELIFVQAESVTPELRNFLVGTLAQARFQPLVVLVTPQEPEQLDPLFQRVLTTPVMDIEVLELLKDIRFNQAG